MPKSESPLSPLLDTDGDLRKEYRMRNSIWESKTIPNNEESVHLEQGWTIHRRLKVAIKVQKERNIQERLENKWWVLLYKMGYQEMSQGRHFRILLKKQGSEEEKLVDVYAKDEETVIVSFCIALENIKKKDLQNEIDALHAVKGGISSVVKKFYGADFKPKILWFFVTENIIWSEENILSARKENIKRVTENELPYYTQLVEHLGRAARFQFLAEFLKDQQIPALDNIRVPATRGRLGGKQFYSFVTTPRHLLKIAFVNHRTLDDPEGHPTYQRLIQKKRLREIGEFIKEGGYFPNNLLVNFMKIPRFEIIEKSTTTDVHYGHLYLPSTYKSAWIIDGQHRLYGYAELGDHYLDSKLIVLAFDGLKKEEEANLFVTINHEQRSVPKNLLDDLEGQLNWGSSDPAERIGAIGARLLQQLNRDLASPFYNRFTAEGLKSTAKSCLTIPQIKSAIKRSKIVGFIENNGSYGKGLLSGNTDNATLIRAQKVFNGYFSAVCNADIGRWDRGRDGRVCTNEGIQAFCILLGEISSYLYKSDESKYLSKKEQILTLDITNMIAPIINFIKDGGQDVDKYFTVPFGSGGPKTYFYKLSKLVNSEFPDFKPADYADWETSQREDLKLQADRQISQINILSVTHIFSVFKKIYGENGMNYWERGVANPDIKANAYRKRTQDPLEDQGPYENYLDFIDLKKIVEKQWKIFKHIFDIPMPGVKGIAKNIDWMDRINELRRISAHPSPTRNYKSTDFPLIDNVCTTLESRIVNFDYASVVSESWQEHG